MANKKKFVDIEKIQDIFQNIDEDKKILANEMIEELMFMKETMSNCRSIVKEVGVIELFQQGSNQFNRENPAIKTYNTTIKNYNAVMKQLLDLLPKDEPKEQKPINPLLEFMNE